MNEDRHLIVGDGPVNSEPVVEEVQQEEQPIVEEPVIEAKPEKKVNAAVILVVIGVIAVVGYFASLLIIPVLFNKKVEPDVKKNIALQAACSNVDKNGNYSSGEISCKNYVCTVTLDGKKQTKECTNMSNATRNVDPEDSLEDEELEDLVDIGG